MSDIGIVTRTQDNVKHKLFRIGTSPQFPLHTARQCNCGRWGCATRQDDEVLVMFTWGHSPEFYTVACAAEALRDDAAHCIRWVWLTPATRRRMQAERTVEVAMVTLFQEVA